MQQEAMRLKPMMKVAFRRALEDTTVGGLHVPKGTMVTLSARKVRLPSTARPNSCVSWGR